MWRLGNDRVPAFDYRPLADDLVSGLNAVRRELLEETGYKAGSLTHLGEFVDNGNQRGCIGNFFIAHHCDQIAEPDSGDLNTA